MKKPILLILITLTTSAGIAGATFVTLALGLCGLACRRVK